MEDYNKLKADIIWIKNSLKTIEQERNRLDGWLSKNHVKRFLDYSENQLRVFEKNGTIIYSKIGRRKFYLEESIINLLKKNIVK